jgi:hypothetical protein
MLWTGAMFLGNESQPERLVKAFADLDVSAPKDQKGKGDGHELSVSG